MSHFQGANFNVNFITNLKKKKKELMKWVNKFTS